MCVYEFLQYSCSLDQVWSLCWQIVLLKKHSKKQERQKMYKNITQCRLVKKAWKQQKQWQNSLVVMLCIFLDKMLAIYSAVKVIENASVSVSIVFNQSVKNYSDLEYIQAKNAKVDVSSANRQNWQQRRLVLVSHTSFVVACWLWVPLVHKFGCARHHLHNWLQNCWHQSTAKLRISAWES